MYSGSRSWFRLTENFEVCVIQLNTKYVVSETYVLASQCLGFVLKKLNLGQHKQTTQEQNGYS